MIKKQNLRINVLAAAVLSLTGVGLAQAADLKANAPLSGPKTQQVDGIIVKYRAGSAAAADANAKLAVVNSAIARAVPAGTNAAARSAALRPQVARKLGIGADLIRLQGGIARAELDKVLGELKADPTVEYAVADAIMYPIDAASSPRADAVAKSDASPSFVPNDPYYQSHNWHFHNPVGGVNAPAAWDVSQGEGIVVAVLDTGILPEHPDFAAGTLLEGYDFISQASRSRRAADGRVPGALDYGDWMPTANACYDGSPVRDSSWHGTHVTGTIAEATNNGLHTAGLAYKAKVLPVRVLGYCGGTLSDITDAITWASGGTVAGIPANQNPAEIINMSLGGSGSCDPAYQAAITGATNRGTLVVVAAGNDSMNVANARPANCDGVVSVGATGITGAMAYYSNFGTRIDLSGPGGGVTDGNPNGYVWQAVSSSKTSPPAAGSTEGYTLGGKAGTSMAAPHVAAVAALVQSALIAANRDPLAPAGMRTLLKETARPFPVSIPSATPIGTGIVDAKAALDKALEEPCTENCGPVAKPLTNKVAIGGLSGAAGSSVLYSFEAAAGRQLSVITYGGTGNVSVYLAKGREPSATDNDARSTRPGTSETVRVTAPTAGTYYIKVVGEAAYSGVSILATQ
ncbi:S8 family serine peptidase [Stenotrophomonas maltophilia]|uniref:S8 family serine peptidase n=2 Tax=Stenotrophomonas maltophilia TaxID=40324 RepID=UPI00066AF536|nr:S8 family serine peptidase [Stenotrophomonas maltophilia]ASE53299.1 protease [Stenotrophomonas maltophilia]MDH2062190.1 S8 family serine peptidase [Stenotrophomonas maltophilia]HDX0898887.1 S8 family serine peptidase [Stenotrophomonas maltophilia]HDX0917185.1 S8 family serine peptidase [Stenotrophomonas maltophilia]HEL3012187.1 S8 family serine peptidase [Stenotrophomonas maltophilia]